MSHAATNWALQQRGLKPASKVVLLFLAYHYNPRNGCFPSQNLLASECEMHRDTVGVHLAELEKRKLIQRKRMFDPSTKRHKSTRYTLAFERGFLEVTNTREAAKAVPEIPARNEGEAISEFLEVPCRNFEESRAGYSGSNIVKEKINEPVRAVNSSECQPEGFERFWNTFPRKRDKARCIELFKFALSEGVLAARIIKAAERYATESANRKSMYQAYSDIWLDRRRWEDYPEQVAPIARVDAVRDAALFWAQKVKAGKYIPQTAISAEVAACMVGSNFVEEQDLRRIGIRI